MPTTVSDLTDIVYSGDFRVDALLDRPPVWNCWPDGRKVLYYTFDAGAASMLAQKAPQGVVAFNTAQKQAARSILQYVQDLTGIVFAEVSGSFQADVHFGATNLQGSSVAGVASSFYTYNYQSNGVLTQLNAEAMVYLDNVEHAGINMQPVSGSLGYEVLLHEVGHMLGLAHPFDSPRPLTSGYDNTHNTVMSYTNQGAYKSQFQSYDVLALQWLYGGDGLAGTWGLNSTNGPSLAPLPQPERFLGTALADRFFSMAAVEYFDGAGGIDTVTFHGRRAEYTLTAQGSSWQVADTVPGRDGTDAVERVERLRFTDYAVALDLDGAAGTAARLMGAVVGAGALNHRDWVGVVLSAVDSGMPGSQLASLALQAVLGGSATNAQVVSLVYTNLFHAAPDVTTWKTLTALLDSGGYSRADLVEFAAGLQVNADNIGLVGLAAGGLEFLPL